MRDKYKINLEEAKRKLDSFAEEIHNEISGREGPYGDHRNAVVLKRYETADLAAVYALLQGTQSIPEESFTSYANVAAECIWNIIRQNNWFSDEESPVFESLVILVRIAETDRLIVENIDNNIFFASLRGSTEDSSEAFSLAMNNMNRSVEFLAELEHVLDCLDPDEEDLFLTRLYLEQAEEKAAGHKDGLNTGTVKLGLYEFGSTGANIDCGEFGKLHFTFGCDNDCRFPMEGVLDICVCRGATEDGFHEHMGMIADILGMGHEEILSNLKEIARQAMEK